MELDLLVDTVLIAPIECVMLNACTAPVVVVRDKIPRPRPGRRRDDLAEDPAAA
jgi:hypothetical protein